jgi:hypothetical protein
MLGMAEATAQELIRANEPPPAPIPGSGQLSDRHERFARARALLLPKVEAYCQAFRLDRSTLTLEQLHAARGNASRLERRREVEARIAYLAHQEEAVVLEKRRRLEEFLWLIHEHNPAELWEVEDRVLLNKAGNPVIVDDKPVTYQVQRARMLADLPEDLCRVVEAVQITDSGKVVTKTYSKMEANRELRKLLGLGATNGPLSDDVGEMSTTQIVAELNALGVEVKIGVQVTHER